MCASLTDGIQTIVQTIALIRNSTFQCSSLQEFRRRCIHQLKDTWPEVPLGSSPIKMCFPSLLHSILSSAHRVYLITHSCLQYYVEESMSLRPLRVVNEDFSYARPLPKGTPWQPLWKRRPEARPYQPKNSGPPSWVEEHRAARALSSCSTT